MPAGLLLCHPAWILPRTPQYQYHHKPQRMKRFAFALLALVFAASGAMAQSASTDAASTESATTTKTAVYTLQKTGDGYQLEGQDQAPATQKEGLYNAVEQANGQRGAGKASGCCAKKGASAAAAGAGCSKEASAAKAEGAGCSKEASAAKAGCGATAKAGAGKSCCSKDKSKVPQ
jgi:hypothetical protein